MSSDKLARTLLEIWGGHCEDGDYVFVSTKNQETGAWRDKSFRYGENLQQELKGWVDKNSPDKLDLYYCPLPFTKAKRKKDAVKGSRYLWSDLDQVDISSLPISPSIHWESSPGRFQGLWELDKFLSAKEAEALNKELTYAVGADKSGWDLTQVLRIPGTRNHKYPGSPRVGPAIKTGQRYKVQDLDLPPWEEEASAIESDIPELDPIIILSKYRKKLPRKVVSLLTTRSATVGKRSDMLWYLENQLLDAGLSPPEIFCLIKNSVWNKYAGRADEDLRLKTELSKIIEGNMDEEKPKPPVEKETKAPDSLSLTVESYSDVMGSLRSRPSWLVEGFWMRRSHGIVAGEPKSFKSTLTLDLAVSVASGMPFLGQYPVLESGPVLIIQNENADWIMKDRLEKIAANKGVVGKATVKGRRLYGEWPQELPLHFINQQGFMLSDPAHQRIAEKLIEEYKPVLVFFDPLYLMFDGEINSAKELNPVLNWLLEIKNKYNTGVILIHHWNKGGTSARGGQRMLGSTTLHGWVESAWYIQVKGSSSGGEEDDEGITKTSGEPVSIVIEREFRGGGTRGKVEAALSMGDIGDPSYKVELKRHVGKGYTAATGEAKGQLLNYLEMTEDRVSQRKLAEETGVGRKAIRKLLDELAEEGKVNITKEGIMFIEQ